MSVSVVRTLLFIFSGFPGLRDLNFPSFPVAFSYSRFPSRKRECDFQFPFPFPGAKKHFPLTPALSFQVSEKEHWLMAFRLWQCFTFNIEKWSFETGSVSIADVDFVGGNPSTGISFWSWSCGNFRCPCLLEWPDLKKRRYGVLVSSHSVQINQVQTTDIWQKVGITIYYIYTYTSKTFSQSL